MKVYEVKEDGIYKNDYAAIGGEINKEYIQLATNVMPKEIFIEAYKKWIEEPMINELIKYKQELESEKND